MRVQSKDLAIIFRVSKESLLQHTDGINRHLAAPPYLYMPVIHQNKGSHGGGVRCVFFHEGDGAVGDDMEDTPGRVLCRVGH